MFIKIKSKSGLTAAFTEYGATLVNLWVPDSNGSFADIVLGYDSIDEYKNSDSCQGATLGRYANRIAGGKFTLNGITYNLPKNDPDYPNTLHGGRIGFHKKVWRTEKIGEFHVEFNYTSPDGEEGFPGESEVRVRYSLTDDSLKIEYIAKSDRDTIFNPSNHAYFNLGGYNSGDVLDTQLRIFANFYTPFDSEKIPTGESATVKGTVFDFTRFKSIGQDIVSGKIDNYDHNYILGEAGTRKPAATAFCQTSGRVMKVYTTMPAIQLYTAKALNETGKGGVHTGAYAGFCLETQFTPNTPNMPHFPQCILKKGEVFTACTEYEFSVN